MQTLRPYQQQAIEKLRGQFSLGRKRVMLQLPTGGGKTAIGADMIRSAITRGRKCLFVCDRLELIDQASERFDMEGIPHGIIQANHPRTDPDAPLQVCSIQTLNRRRMPEFQFCVIDEAHVIHQAHKRLMEVNAAFVGLSATPFAKGLGKIFDSLVVGATTSELIEQGYLVQPRVWAPSMPDLSKVRTIAGDYDEKQLAEATDRADLVGDIVQHWHKLAAGRQTIGFAVNIAHSLHMVHEFNAAGVKAAHLDAYTPKDERRRINQQLRTGEIQILINVDIVSKGADFPGVSALILARPTKSLMLHVQQCGRGLRIDDGKNDCIILDHAGNTERHGFVTDRLPNTLDLGEKTIAGKRDKPEAKATKCSKCHYVKAPKVHICPNCGHKPVRKPDVKTEDGNLVEVTKRAIIDKQYIYSQLVAISLEHGYSSGWCSHKYKTYTGVWPRGLASVPITPTPEMRNWIKHQNIKWAKRRVA